VRKGEKNHLLIHPLRVLNQRRLWFIIIFTNTTRMDSEKASEQINAEHLTESRLRKTSESMA